jgi:hypothetical protein
MGIKLNKDIGDNYYLWKARSGHLGGFPKQENSSFCVENAFGWTYFRFWK